MAVIVDQVILIVADVDVDAVVEPVLDMVVLVRLVQLLSVKLPDIPKGSLIKEIVVVGVDVDMIAVITVAAMATVAMSVVMTVVMVTVAMMIVVAVVVMVVVMVEVVVVVVAAVEVVVVVMVVAVAVDADAVAAVRNPLLKHLKKIRRRRRST